MTQIEIADDMVLIDADVLAKAFGIGADDLKRQMRDGTITSRFERGAEEDAGRVRLTFFSADLQVQITADESGTVLSCCAVDFTQPTVPAWRPVRTRIAPR